MFILHISHNELNKSLTTVKHLKNVKTLLINNFMFLRLTKQNKSFKNLTLVTQKQNSINNLAKYIVGISLSNTNVNIYISDIKGSIVYSLSAGSASITGKQKRKKSIVLIKLLQFLTLKVKFIGETPVVLHLKNFTNFYTSLVLSAVEKHLVIDAIRIYNNKPYNGCRPKKVKRKKHKKIKF